MKIVTIDASVAVSWLLPAQATAFADAFLADSGDRQFTAPSVFAWEIGNLIATKARRARLESSALLRRLEVLAIEVAPPPDAETVLSFVQAAAKYDLSLFDTAYLLHALGHGGALASRDARLLDAAAALGVETHDLRDETR